MTERELRAAGITGPELRAAYTFCRRLNARHGRTYFLATRFLPAERRPAVHALYGFARWADDIVDDLGGEAGPRERADALRGLEQELHGGLRTGTSREPVIRALAHTADEYAIDHRHFTDFMASMRMDLEVGEYRSWADLARYTHGSAAVIGLQMVPVLGTVVPRAEAEPHAAALGVAFQLTNFLRDVGEDLDRGRIYLPLDLLASHGVDRELLEWSRRTGGTDRRIRAALVEAADHTRGAYREAEPGIDMLDPVSRPCIRAAFTLYGEILDAVAAAGYPVLRRRVAVSGRRRAVVALGALWRAARGVRARGDAGRARGDAYGAAGSGPPTRPPGVGAATGTPGAAPDASGRPAGATRAAVGRNHDDRDR